MGREEEMEIKCRKKDRAQQLLKNQFPDQARCENKTTALVFCRE